MIHHKALESIDLQDIQNLMDDSIEENMKLEYKKLLNLSGEKEKGEFLADISSFANSSGGDLIFGVIEENGIITSIPGFNCDNIDQFKLQIDQIIREGIEPRIFIEIHPITISEGIIVLIIRVKESWNGPHRVTYKYVNTKGNFYGRTSAGKYQLNIDQIRRAFNLSEHLTEKVEKFKSERIMKLLSGDTDLPFTFGDGKIAIHLIPLEAFQTPYRHSIEALKAQATLAEPLYSGGGRSKLVNINGVLVFSSGGNNDAIGYTQLYRSGIIEVVDSSLLGRSSIHAAKLLPTGNYEQDIPVAITKYLTIIENLGYNGPVIVSITFIGVKEYNIPNDGRHPPRHLTAINRDIITLPDILLNTPQEFSSEQLVPLFDIMRNACGWEKSLNFDENKQWKQNRR